MCVDLQDKYHFFQESTSDLLYSKGSVSRGIDQLQEMIVLYPTRKPKSMFDIHQVFRLHSLRESVDKTLTAIKSTCNSMYQFNSTCSPEISS